MKKSINIKPIFSLFYETIPLFKRVNQPLDPQQCFPVLIPLTDMSWWPSHWLPDYSVFPLVKSQPISSLYSGCVASKNHIMTSRLGCWKTTLFYWIYIHSWICAIKSHTEWLKYWLYWSKLRESLILITCRSIWVLYVEFKKYEKILWQKNNNGLVTFPGF